jgi:adenylate cyclase
MSDATGGRALSRGVYEAGDLGDMKERRRAGDGIAPAGPGSVEVMADSVERKLTTILCADVHGYTRLMEQDEAATLATLRLYREAIDGLVVRHRGRIVSTAGDSLLADFPSVVEAVQCAIEIQQELAGRNRSLPDARRLAFRIGINLGDVMVHGGDLFGEGVNIAARLEALAEPGGICISRTVYDQVRNKLTVGFDFLGEQTVKNISEPVPVFRVRLDGGVEDGVRRPGRSPAPRPADRAASDHAWRTRRFRRRAVGAALLITLLCIINLLTSRYLWFIWPTLFIGGHLAWDALRAYYPDDVGRQKIGGDVTFSRDATFRGTIGGNVLVARGVHLQLIGKVGGNLTLERDAIAEVRGNIKGDVRNRGGTLRLSGKLGGELRDEEVAGAAADHGVGRAPAQRF